MNDYQKRARKLRKTGNELDSMAEKLVDKTGEKIVSRAKSIVPVRTGRLQRSIRYEKEKAPGEVSMEIIADGHEEGKISYASFVEYGTRKMMPRPYIRPALNEYIGAFEDGVKNLLRDLLK